jgi:tRNA pseudouridine55 synthase
VPERLELPVGELMQRPPAYSAVKLGGERLYRKARRGEAVEGEERPVVVHRAELLGAGGDTAEFEIECSAGTYVRQLVAGLGDAYCERLERTAIGPFRLADADPGRLLGLAEALAFMPARELGAEDARAVRHGRRIPGMAEGAVRLMHAGEVLAIAEPRGADLQPVVVFAPR